MQLLHFCPHFLDQSVTGADSTSWLYAWHLGGHSQQASRTQYKTLLVLPDWVSVRLNLMVGHRAGAGISSGSQCLYNNT
jgi:hypothetical protein